MDNLTSNIYLEHNPDAMGGVGESDRVHRNQPRT